MKDAGTLIENQALLQMSAIDGLAVNNCEFLNMQGGGINIALTSVGGTDTGLRNRNIRIITNLLDGVNCAGRNGISVIAGEDILIKGTLSPRPARSYARATTPLLP